MTIIKFKGLSGDQTVRLLDNPDRGFRLESYLDVKTGKGIYQYQDEDGIAAFEQELTYYSSDHAHLVQVYFYLTGYLHADIDRDGFRHMEQFLENLKRHKMKALLRVAYIWDDAHPDAQTPSETRMLRHIDQLSRIFSDYQDVIHVVQAGLIGPWGEWSNRSREKLNETLILKSLMQSVPPSLTIQVRYLNIYTRNVSVNESTALSRIGFHDDFLIGHPHMWNIAGQNRDSIEFQNFLSLSRHRVIDGEMIWAWANRMYLEHDVIDYQGLIQYLIEGHFTSLSIAHNYHELVNQSFSRTVQSNEANRLNKAPTRLPAITSLLAWQKSPITADELDALKWPYQPEWFQSITGEKISQSVYTYLRDYLGYRLQLMQVNDDAHNGFFDITLKNFGFAAPVGLRQLKLVAVDQVGNVSGEVQIDTDTLQPGRLATFRLIYHKTNQGKMFIRALADGGQLIRLANESQVNNESSNFLITRSDDDD
ncbi:DUF4874 domain-containing protein [Lacticaseibacillus rhamnosus]|uniref:DUF4874 domain-containing protein n=1 Tax=Lacticaseibacillus rhamnosus TaxID=47715 RepID=UPI0023E095E0|nr:DUF4874 domain-containing protein [Lacticaseibacillus rhamnosus]MDF3335697.1 DUF4874 domain-containing protein [Lacticaseibacillus rhamnosus]